MRRKYIKEHITSFSMHNTPSLQAYNVYDLDDINDLVTIEAGATKE